MSCCGEAAPPPNVAVAKGFSDVFEFIEAASTNCLNQKDEHPWQAMLKGGEDDQFCESNVDEQLLLNIGFREKVKIKGIMIKGSAGHEDQSPSDVQIFVNTGTMGFSDVESQKPAQLLTLEAEDVENGKCHETNFVRFQNVQNLSIFVERNHGDTETTVINRIQLIGCSIMGTNMSDLKKVG